MSNQIDFGTALLCRLAFRKQFQPNVPYGISRIERRPILNVRVLLLAHVVLLLAYRHPPSFLLPLRFRTLHKLILTSLPESAAPAAAGTAISKPHLGLSVRTVPVLMVL